MMNVYNVKLAKEIKLDAGLHHFGRTTTWLYVVASSFENAIVAVQRKYPGVEIRGVDLLNYTGVPIVSGE